MFRDLFTERQECECLINLEYYHSVLDIAYGIKALLNLVENVKINCLHKYSCLILTICKYFSIC